nr:VWA domain-containing protein [Candidatus Sigynarchaeota archaeon]
NPVLPLERMKIIQVNDVGGKNVISLHPIVSQDLNLFPHFLEILRGRFGIVVSKRMQNFGRYMKYLDSMAAQVQFLAMNLNVPMDILLDAIKGLYSIRMGEKEDLMSFQDALRFYRYKENLNEKAVSAMRVLGENMHLLSKNDLVYLKQTLLTVDKIAAQTEAVKQEFTRFSVNAFLSGVIKFDDMLEYENTDELITLSLLMKMDPADRMKVQAVDMDDPISNLIRKFLNRDLPKGRRKAIIDIIASFFRDFFVREGFLKDLNLLIKALQQKEFDVKSTLFKTMKKMQIWTPVFKQKVKASSRNILLVNDLSGSMIASYIGQVELFQGLIDAMKQDMESEIVFISFSNDSFAYLSNKSKNDNKEELLGLLTEYTMGLTDINCALETIKTGKPTRGDTFTPPHPETTIVFFISDLQETIGGSLDYELIESVVRNCKKFFVSIPNENFSNDNYAAFVEAGAIPVPFENVSDIPAKIVKLMASELAG